MIRFIVRLLHFSKEYAGKLKLSFILSFFEGILYNLPVFTALTIFSQALSNTLTYKHAGMYGALILASLILCCILKRLFVMLESGTGYNICARERLSVGDRLKRFPMGFFSDGNIGNITSAITVDLLFVEEHGMAALDKVINGYCGILSGCLMLVFLDWTLAAAALVLTAIALFILEWVQKAGSEQSFIRQKQSAVLTDSVLEYVQGISVIKSLNMNGDKAKRIKAAIENTCRHSIEFEEKFIKPNTVYQYCFSVGIAVMVYLTMMRFINGNIDLPAAMMLLIYVFFLFKPIQALGSLTSQIRIMEACLNRYEKLSQVDIIDESGKDIPVSGYDIEFQHVSFAYEQDTIIHDISFKAPEKSITALVGASGSGKTTIANLIMRFWDVQQGAVTIGGVNIKEMTCESLLRNMSMVFQNVYLFQDTIRNNIRYGKQEATDAEIESAAKKARCHDFITSLPDGYETQVGAGGCTLSGGEKQRISIARAILKDAPIILLDEMTSSIDPENEKFVRQAIDELVQDKTMIVIAHRLTTIQHADQILVIENGSIVQNGVHKELIVQNGPYRKLWESRMYAQSWQISH